MTTASHPAVRHRAEAGFSLVELLITLVVLSMIMGTTVLFFQNQSRSFARGTESMDVLQNARFSITHIERILRTLGAGVTGEQPMLAYGGNDVVAFNTDYTETDTTDFRWAVNWNPDIPAEAAMVWRLEDAATIPNSSPAYTYPPRTFVLGNGLPSPAETKIFWFEPDVTTDRDDDYVLWERTNNGEPEYIARNILAYPGRPFFEYFLDRRTVGVPNLVIASGADLPLRRRPVEPTFTDPEKEAAVRPDSVKAVRINIRVTNGKTGAEERTRDFSQLVQVPNNGLPSPVVCGRSPFPPIWLSANPGASGSGLVRVMWGKSPDHGGGEYDIRQYVVYVRPDTATVWRDPLVLIPADDTTTVYETPVGGLTTGATYRFGVVAQDCTPSSSSVISQLQMAP